MAAPPLDFKKVNKFVVRAKFDSTSSAKMIDFNLIKSIKGDERYQIRQAKGKTPHLQSKVSEPPQNRLQLSRNESAFGKPNRPTTPVKSLMSFQFANQAEE
mmetsp:Transcript_18406/g.31479  ORF Transcript_18406/g.31479 Transcript_18406/m.31479 type:complete len:101 (+) Transcript_18406:179-481(+)